MITITAIVIITAVVLLIIYDVIVALVYGKSSTISATLYKYAKIYPLIPFAIGMLMGHFFWPI